MTINLSSPNRSTLDASINACITNGERLLKDEIKFCVWNNSQARVTPRSSQTLASHLGDPVDLHRRDVPRFTG
jgi:hypothetical protein